MISADYDFVSIGNLSFLFKTKKYKSICRFCFGALKSDDLEQDVFLDDLSTMQLPKTKYFKNNEL